MARKPGRSVHRSPKPLLLLVQVRQTLAAPDRLSLLQVFSLGPMNGHYGRLSLGNRVGDRRLDGRDQVSRRGSGPTGLLRRRVGPGQGEARRQDERGHEQFLRWQSRTQGEHTAEPFATRRVTSIISSRRVLSNPRSRLPLQTCLNGKRYTSSTGLPSPRVRLYDGQPVACSLSREPTRENPRSASAKTWRQAC